VWRLEAARSADAEAAEIALQRAEAEWAALDGFPGVSGVPGINDTAVAERFMTAAAAVRERVSEARAKAAQEESQQTEIVRRRAEEQAARRRAANAVAEKEAARRRARLIELAEEAEAALNDAELGSARRRVEVARREWRDLSSGAPVDSEVA